MWLIIFIASVTWNAEAESLTHWPPDVKSQLIRQDPDAGQDWRQEERGRQRMRWLNGITDSMDMIWASSGRWKRTGKNSTSVLQSMGLQRVRHDWATEQQHKLVRSCLKSCMLGLRIMRTKNFQMSKLGLEKAEEPDIKLPTFAGSQRKQGNFRKTSTSVSSTTLKPLTVWIMTNCGKLCCHPVILFQSWATLLFYMAF